jgi:hypothetical protein
MVERHEHADAVHGESEQVGVGDLPRVEPTFVREARGFEHGEVIRPELVVRRGGGLGEASRLGRDRLRPRIRAVREDAQTTVLGERAGGPAGGARIPPAALT